LIPAPATTAPFFVYILRCADDSLYVGHTSDVPARVITHKQGRAALWTAARRPVVLVYTEPAPSEVKAVQREHQIKHWTHAKKTALIEGNLKQLKSLAKRRSP
jgi:predicted GIY-YIG superfamily endonuclease